MYYLPTSCVIFLYLVFLFQPLPCVSSKLELGLCDETLFQCGNITAGFPFWGENRHKHCGHPSLGLHCNIDITSIFISNQEFIVLHLNQTSNTLTLARTDHLGYFCFSSFTNITLPPQVFELSPTYKSLTLFYHCDPSLSYLSSYKCPEKCFILGPENHETCHENFTVNVPKSFVPEEKKDRNLANLERALNEGFEVKVKACEGCLSSPERCVFNESLPSGFKCLPPPTASELHKRCRLPFSCGNRNGLLYPFWITGREECGHPEFKLECNTSSGFAEVSISSVKFRILETNHYTSRIIKLARSEYINGVCPQNPLNAPFNENILPLASGTEPLTIYYGCPEFSTSSYVGELDCDGGRSYFVTRNLSSYLLQDMSRLLNDFIGFCKRNVSIPASGSALITLQNDPTEGNFKKAVEEGFEVRLHQECLMCMDSGGACGFNKTLNPSGFVCYCVDEPRYHTCVSRKKGISSLAKIGSGAAGAIMFLFLVLLTTVLKILGKRKRKTSHDMSQQNLKALIPQQDLKTLIPQHDLKALIPLKQYSYANVKRITKSFAEVVGKGGFGTVYRGTLCDGRSVAVKVLKDLTGNSGEDFINEVASMSQTSHVNIVTLLGFCAEGSKRVILYEFLENGSLDKFISSKRSSNMDWTALYRIALGVARGLEYLHHGCRTRIVHFDIKPQNVLLDDNLCPKVSDFGLAKLCERKESILSLLDARGTIGYIAPEVFSRVYGRVSHKSDVYSYGMLVLEMIGARTRTSTEDTASSTSSMYFPEWIYKDLEKGDNGRLIEDGINSEEEEIAKKMTLVGLWCIQSWPSNRPPMNRVVEMLEGNVNALELPPKPVLHTPAEPLQESSMTSEDISVYADICSMNVS